MGSRATPTFPSFKRLELSDRDAIDALTARYPLYSDFDFASLFAWDILEDMEWCAQGASLIVRFTDYDTHRPFYTFIGLERVNQLVAALLTLAGERSYEPSLELVPDCVMEQLDCDAFSAEPARDHFDYVYEVHRHVTFSGTALKHPRFELNRFRKAHPAYEVERVNLSERCSRDRASMLWRKWAAIRGADTPNEHAAFSRLICAWDALGCVGMGIVVDGDLIGLNLSRPRGDEWVNALFAKADIRYAGAYAALDNEVSKWAIETGARLLNGQQDLGLAGLRRAKLSLAPTLLLKKGKVLRRGATPRAKCDVEK